MDASCRIGQSLTSLNPIVTEAEIAELQKAFPESKRKTMINKCRQNRFHEARQTHYLVSSHNNGTSNVERHSDDLLESDNPRIQPTPTRYFRLLLRYDEPRARAIEAFWGEKDTSLQGAVDPLMQMVNPTRRRLYYPGTNPERDPYWKQYVKYLI